MTFTRSAIAVCVLSLLTSATALGWTSAPAGPGDAYDIEIDSSGNIWVAGETGSPPHFAWAKFSPTGVLLTNCQSDGCDPPIPFSGYAGRAYAIAIDATNDPTVVGYELTPEQNWDSQFTVMRGGHVYDIHENVVGGHNEARDVAITPNSNNKAVIVGFTTVASPEPHHTEGYASVADADANEVAFRNLPCPANPAEPCDDWYALGDSRLEGVAVFADNTAVVVGKAWVGEAPAQNDVIYVHRIQIAAPMNDAWASPWFAGSPGAEDTAYDVAAKGNHIGVAGERNGQFFVSSWHKDDFAPKSGFPHQPITGAAYAVAVDEAQNVIAVGEDENGDLYITKRTDSNGAVSGWPKTLPGVDCTFKKCDVAVDDAANDIVVVASKDGKIWSRKWDKDGNAIGGEVLSTSGTTARAVDVVTNTNYVVASNGGMRATAYGGGCAMSPRADASGLESVLLLLPMGLLWRRRR